MSGVPNESVKSEFESVDLKERNLGKRGLTVYVRPQGHRSTTRVSETRHRVELRCGKLYLEYRDAQVVVEWVTVDRSTGVRQYQGEVAVSLRTREGTTHGGARETVRPQSDDGKDGATTDWVVRPNPFKGDGGASDGTRLSWTREKSV